MRSSSCWRRWRPPRRAPPSWSGSLFIAANTFAGPLYFGAGVGENGRYTLYLLLGAH